MRAAVAGLAVVARAAPRTSPRAETHRRREPLPLVRASTAGKFQQRRRRTRVDALTTRASTRRRAEDGPIASIDAPRSRAVAAMASASASASASDGDSAAFSRELFGNVTAEEGARALYRCTLTVCLAMLSVGCACGAIAGALVYIESGTILGTLTTTMKGAVVAALPLGAMFGCAATPALNEPFGRRFALAVCDVGFIVSALLMATATSINQVILGRFVAGLAVGTATSMCTVYISECAPAKTRGKHSGLAPLSVTIGLLTSFIVSLLATGLADGWRFMFAAAALPALAQLAIMRFTRWLPESPRWLAENCRVGDAKAVLNSLGQPDVDVHVIALNATTRPSMKILTLFKDAKTRDALGVASLMNFFQQACGINVVIYYAPKILNDIGFDRSHAIALTACVSVIQILAGTWLSRTVDSVGRRPMAIGGIGVISFALGLLTLSVTPSVYSYFMSATAAPWLAVVAILLFRIAFSVSLGPMPYIVTSEVFPQKVRNVGVSAATGVQWVMNALVTFTFLRIREIWSAQGVWMLYFAVSLCALVVVYKVLPETSGKSLEAN